MSRASEEFMREMDRKLAKVEMLSGRDLVDAGLVKHGSMLSRWRRKGIGPGYVKLGERKVMYPRAGVLEWLRRRYRWNGVREKVGGVKRVSWIKRCMRKMRECIYERRKRGD